MLQLSRREILIISLFLKTNEYITSEEIASQCLISVRTVMRQIPSIQTVLKQNGANIESKRKKGYRIEVIAQDKFESFKRSVLLDYSHGTVFNQSTMAVYKNILSVLLCEHSEISIDILAERIYVSRNSAISYLNKVKEDMPDFHLMIESSPKGIQLTGKEINKRVLALELLKGNYYFSPTENIYIGFAELFYDESYNSKKEKILSTIFHSNIHIYHPNINKIINYIILAKNRIAQSFHANHSFFVLKVEKSSAYLCASNIFQELDMDVSDDEIAYMTMILMENENISLEQYLDHNHQAFYMEATQLIEPISFFCQKIYTVNFSEMSLFRQGMLEFLIPFFAKNYYQIACSKSYSKDIAGASVPNDPLAIDIAKMILQYLKKDYGYRFNVSDIRRLLIIMSCCCNNIQYTCKKISICNVIATEFYIADQIILPEIAANIERIKEIKTISYWEYDFLEFPADVMLIDMYPKVDHKYDIPTVYFDSTNVKQRYSSALKTALTYCYNIEDVINRFAAFTHIYEELPYSNLQDVLHLMAFKYATKNMENFFSRYNWKDFDSFILGNEICFIFVPWYFSESECLDIYSLSKHIETPNKKVFSTLIVVSLKGNKEDLKTLQLIMRGLVNELLYLIRLTSGEKAEAVYEDIIRNALIE